MCKYMPLIKGFIKGESMWVETKNYRIGKLLNDSVTNPRFYWGRIFKLIPRKKDRLSWYDMKLLKKI